MRKLKRGISTSQLVDSEVLEWRNWQTHGTQNPKIAVPSRSLAL